MGKPAGQRTHGQGIRETVAAEGIEHKGTLGGTIAVRELIGLLLKKS